MRLLLVLLALLTACAANRRTAEVRYTDPDVIEVTALERELAAKNDEELLAIGTAAQSAGDDVRAAAAFGRLADAHPASPHVPAALRGAAIALGRQARWPEALERLRALEARADGALRVEARFRIAEARYHLRELEAARDALDRLAADPDLAPALRVRALAQRGVVELELGRPVDAERSLREALARFDEASATERLAPRDAAQAQFHLGELYRESARAIALDPASRDEAALARDLEEKAQLLLSAQGHYLRAIRLGDVEFAIAAGERIGGLYDGLHRELSEAPLPKGLEPAQEEAYRAELASDLRVLVEKAISAYEQTIEAARRSGVSDHRFVEEAEASLARLRKLAADE